MCNVICCKKSFLRIDLKYFTVGNKVFLASPLRVKGYESKDGYLKALSQIIYVPENILGASLKLLHFPLKMVDQVFGIFVHSRHIRVRFYRQGQPG